MIQNEITSLAALISEGKDRAAISIRLYDLVSRRKEKPKEPADRSNARELADMMLEHYARTITKAKYLMRTNQKYEYTPNELMEYANDLLVVASMLLIIADNGYEAIYHPQNLS